MASKQHVLAVGGLSDRRDCRLISFQVGVMSPHISTGIQRKGFILWAEIACTKALRLWLPATPPFRFYWCCGLMSIADSKAGRSQAKSPKGWLNMGEHGWTKRIVVQVSTELLDILLRTPAVIWTPTSLPEVPDEFITGSTCVPCSLWLSTLIPS